MTYFIRSEMTVTSILIANRASPNKIVEVHHSMWLGPNHINEENEAGLQTLTTMERTRHGVGKSMYPTTSSIILSSRALQNMDNKD